MTGPRSRFPILARLTLILAAAFGALWLSRLDFDQKISTNVVDLIPVDEREPELHLLRTLANDVQARVVLIALSTPDGPPAPEAIETLVTALRAAPEFAEVELVSDSANREALGRWLYEHRQEYLLPEYLARQRKEFDVSGAAADQWPAWLAERVARELADFLHQPENSAFDELVLSDPLLLVPALAQSAELIAPPADATADSALVWARIVASPLEEAGQEPVFDALDRALQGARQINPATTLRWTGVNRFAAASRTRIRGEMTWLNLGSVLGVLTVAALLVRRPWRVLHLVPTVLLSQLGAWVVVMLVFERVHILVFVIGALLTGAAIDYGFHLYLPPAGRPERSYRDKLRRVLKPLLASCLTTVIGFSLLWWSDLPLLRHVGVFVTAGLLSALGAALLYFGQLGPATIEPRVARRPFRRRIPPTARRIMIATLAAFCLGGLLRLRWHDDIRALEVPAPELQRNDHEVRALFGETSDRAVYLTRGDNLVDARARLAVFLDWHEHAFPESGIASIGAILPTREAYEAVPSVLRTLGGFSSALRGSLERHGFLPDSFESFFRAWSRLPDHSWPDYATLADRLRAQLTGPSRFLINEGADGAWLLTITDHAPGGLLPAELGTVEVNQLQTLNRLFERYRRNALRLSLGGLGLVGVSVLALYGIRHGLRVFVIPVGACFFTFGLLGWIGAPLNLFHLLGAFLGVCLTHDYAIFALSVRTPGSPPPPSIRLAAATTAASFGVLALSRIPVISALGVSVLIIVVAGLVAVESGLPKERTA